MWLRELDGEKEPQVGGAFPAAGRFQSPGREQPGSAVSSQGFVFKPWLSMRYEELTRRFRVVLNYSTELSHHSDI